MVLPKPSTEPRLEILPAGTELWRIHDTKYPAIAFNGSPKARGRFHPLLDAAGELVPVWYGAASLRGALMETVFRDVPGPPGSWALDLQLLREKGLHATYLQTGHPLNLVDLTSVGLKRIGLKRADCIDTLPPTYSESQELAAHLHRTMPTAQGLTWVSRQDDSARAIMLFADRVIAPLQVLVAGEPIWEMPLLGHMLDVSEQLGIHNVQSLD